MEASTILTCIPQRGVARVCPSGCVHVTYGLVTLDFRGRAEFEQLVSAVSGKQALLPQAGRVDVEYRHATLHFTQEEFRQFAGMVTQAAEQLHQVEVVRRLLSERGRS